MGWIILIIVLFFGLGITWIYNFVLYRMGKYIRLKYPVEYEKHLTSSRPFLTEFFNAKKQFPFPYNIGEVANWKGFKNIKKVIDVAEL